MSKESVEDILINKGQYVISEAGRYRVVIHVPADISACAFAKSYARAHFKKHKKDAS